MNWRIYYGDDFTFDSEQGEPTDAPIRNVQVIVQPHIESGRWVQCTSDYYAFWDDRWIGVDTVGVLDFMIELGEITIDDNIDSAQLAQIAAKTGLVKWGRMIPKEHFYELFRKASNDLDLPKRTGYRANEWKPGDNT